MRKVLKNKEPGVRSWASSFELAGAQSTCKPLCAVKILLHFQYLCYKPEAGDIYRFNNSENKHNTSRHCQYLCPIPGLFSFQMPGLPLLWQSDNPNDSDTFLLNSFLLQPLEKAPATANAFSAAILQQLPPRPPTPQPGEPNSNLCLPLRRPPGPAPSTGARFGCQPVPPHPQLLRGPGHRAGRRDPACAVDTPPLGAAVPRAHVSVTGPDGAQAAPSPRRRGCPPRRPPPRALKQPLPDLVQHLPPSEMALQRRRPLGPLSHRGTPRAGALRPPRSPGSRSPDLGG